MCGYVAEHRIPWIYFGGFRDEDPQFMGFHDSSMGFPWFIHDFLCLTYCMHEKSTFIYDYPRTAVTINLSWNRSWVLVFKWKSSEKSFTLTNGIRIFKLSSGLVVNKYAWKSNDFLLEKKITGFDQSQRQINEEPDQWWTSVATNASIDQPA